MGIPLADDIREAMGRNIPAKRIGEVQDVAALVTFLASDDSTYITGQDIACDGGLLAGYTTEDMFDLYGSAMDVLGIPRPPLP